MITTRRLDFTHLKRRAALRIDRQRHGTLDFINLSDIFVVWRFSRRPVRFSIVFFSSSFSVSTVVFPRRHPRSSCVSVVCAIRFCFARAFPADTILRIRGSLCRRCFLLFFFSPFVSVFDGRRHHHRLAVVFL